jgi:hypothetical protein
MYPLAPQDYTVGVDIDGILYKLVPVMRERVRRLLGRSLDSMPDPTEYDMEKSWNLPKGFIFEQLVAGVQEGDIFWTGDAYPEAREALRALKARGYRITLPTTRALPGFEGLCQEATESWLHANGFDGLYDELQVIGADKNTVAHHFLVDDYSKNVTAALAAGRGATLIGRPWNQGFDLPSTTWENVVETVEAHRLSISQAA